MLSSVELDVLRPRSVESSSNEVVIMKLDWDRAAFIKAQKDEFNLDLGDVEDLTKPRYGLPPVIQTNCRTNFTSKVFRGKCAELAIQHVTSEPYHPESRGVVERFQQTFKSVLKKHCYDHDGDWDKALPFVLKNHPNSSTGVAPFELVFRHKVRGLLEIVFEMLKSNWKEKINMKGKSLDISLEFEIFRGHSPIM
ncbi:uncharacterized protein [Palaemon carinicauda]|uniref:uncharacterized protein n=1 Tax=Palaemon carinicauda TaxID=392227 RepID=UPI0035B63F65